MDSHYSFLHMANPSLIDTMDDDWALESVAHEELVLKQPQKSQEKWQELGLSNIETQ